MSSESNEDRIFKALAAPLRRRILDRLKQAPESTGALCEAFPELDRCTVMQHLGVLEEAGLVVARREGRVRWNHLNALPIVDIADRWIGSYAAYAGDKLKGLRDSLT